MPSTPSAYPAAIQVLVVWVDVSHGPDTTQPVNATVNIDCSFLTIDPLATNSVVVAEKLFLYLAKKNPSIRLFLPLTDGALIAFSSQFEKRGLERRAKPLPSSGKQYK